MSKKFQDVEISGVVGLHEEEAQLLLAVAEAILEELTGNNASQVAGTILLDGQPENGEAQLVLRASLPGGAFHRNFSRILRRSSYEIAAESIDELLSAPTESRYCGRYPHLADLVSSYDVPSGFYQDGELSVLVLKATRGRLLLSIGAFRPDEEGKDIDGGEIAMALLYALAWALAKIGDGDPELRESFSRVAYCFNKNSHYASRWNTTAFSAVEKVFGACEIPELRRWRQWRASNLDSGTYMAFIWDAKPEAADS